MPFNDSDVLNDFHSVAVILFTKLVLQYLFIK